MPQPDLIVGLGLRPDTDRTVILDALNAVLDVDRIAGLATLDRRVHDTGVRCVAAALGVPVHGVPVVDLTGVRVEAPSERTAAAVGAPSVAEACAVLVGRGPLLVAKRIVGGVVVAASAVGRADGGNMCFQQ